MLGQSHELSSVRLPIVHDVAAGDRGARDADVLVPLALLIATLVSWNYLLNMLGYYFPVFEKLTDAPPLLLIRNGRALRRN